MSAYSLRYVILALAAAAAAAASTGVQAGKPLNCEGVPYRSVSELTSDDYLKGLSSTRAGPVFGGLFDSAQEFLCNTVARPALWLALVNSKIDMLYLAVMETMQREDIATGERPKKVAWGEFEALLVDETLTGRVLASYANVYARYNLNRNLALKNTGVLVDFACRHLKSNFGPLFAGFQEFERLTKNDQLIHSLAEFDDNLQRVVVVHKACQMMKI